MQKISNSLLKRLEAAFRLPPKKIRKDQGNVDDYYRSLYPDGFVSGLKRRSKIYQKMIQRYAQEAAPPPPVPGGAAGGPGAPMGAPMPGGGGPLDLPPIGGDMGGMGAPPMPPPPGGVAQAPLPGQAPQGTPTDPQIEDLRKQVDALESKINDTKETNEDLEKKIESMEKYLATVKKFAVPERKEYDIDPEYDFNLYEKAVDILDEKINFLPNIQYNWIGSKCSKFYPDGSLKSGVINVTASMVAPTGARFDVHVPMYVIDGKFREPIYGEYRGKIVGLNEEDIAEVLETQSFSYEGNQQKDETPVKSMYSPEGKKVGREPEQKVYDVFVPTSTTHVPENRKWIMNKGNS